MNVQNRKLELRMDFRKKFDPLWLSLNFCFITTILKRSDLLKRVFNDSQFTKWFASHIRLKSRWYENGKLTDQADEFEIAF